MPEAYYIAGPQETVCEDCMEEVDANEEVQPLDINDLVDEAWDSKASGGAGTVNCERCGDQLVRV